MAVLPSCAQVATNSSWVWRGGEADMAIEWWIVLATLGGPVLAVQTQKFIERASENRRQKLAIFATLMANRATRLNDDYISRYRRRRDCFVLNSRRTFCSAKTRGDRLFPQDRHG